MIICAPPFRERSPSDPARERARRRQARLQPGKWTISRLAICWASLAEIPSLDSSGSSSHVSAIPPKSNRFRSLVAHCSLTLRERSWGLWSRARVVAAAWALHATDGTGRRVT